jgi:hypothetical protein
MGRPGASAFMKARFRSRRSPATTARRSGNPPHGAGVSTPITALGRASGGGAGLAGTGSVGVVMGSALRDGEEQPGDRCGLVQLHAARPLAAKLGGRRPAGGGDRGTGTLHAHWWHLWLPGIPLPARAPSMGRRRPGGLGPARTLHGTWRTAEGPRQLRWRAQHGAEAAPELGGGVGGGAGAAPGDEAVGPYQQRSPGADAVGGRRVGGPWRPWMRTNHPRKGDAPPPAHSGASGGRWRPVALGPRVG